MLNDLVFRKDFFGYPITKSYAFRNYLAIMQPEIVNMPDLGFDTILWDNIKYFYNNNIVNAKTSLIQNSIINGAQEYGIVVKSYFIEFSPITGEIDLNNFVLG